MQRAGLSGSDSVFLTPSNWKFLFFGAALVIMMRYRPHGVLPASRSESEPGGESSGGGGTQSPPSATPEGAK
jgi:hypothetical protein